MSQFINKKQFAPKTKWSDQEVKTFFNLYPVYGTDFKMYTKDLDRTYSQIKGFYHNHIRRQHLEATVQSDSSRNTSASSHDHRVQNDLFPEIEHAVPAEKLLESLARLLSVIE
ncbi:Conserved_hypothetical protein [Hexamita inflata]|uniref:Myb-like domain-containing protein n=1 Tax=Hexamita inflata TaxID=28002 RepID=A0ABP1GV37_9EUKA